MMIFIKSSTTDTYFNLAAEEYLLRNSGEEVCMLWQSGSAVISGKHQNVLAEINLRKAVDNNVVIARRISGGGTVYHDTGNINFSFIRNGTHGNMIDFEGNIKPVILFLEKYDIISYRGAKNEIMAGGKKISGNAEHIHRGRLLHHGTLLFRSEIEMLKGILRRKDGEYTDKSVRSNRSEVTNICDLTGIKMTPENFRDELMEFLMNYFKGPLYELSSFEMSEIQKLAENKYSTWGWIYGWSPDYEFRNTFIKEDLDLRIEMKTRRGIILSMKLESRKLNQEALASLAEAFIDKPHSLLTVSTVLTASFFGDILSSGMMDDLIYSFF